VPGIEQKKEKRLSQDVTGKIAVLFLCTGNSCRSQMAEGWARHLKADLIDPRSAGIEPKGVDPRAVKVMAEAGVDISAHTSKLASEFPQDMFDYVITLCSDAEERCPMFPAKTSIVHRGFDDPPELAKEADTEEEALSQYRRIRDEIRVFVGTLPESLPGYRVDKQK
jgi:arsenate reductase